MKIMNKNGFTLIEVIAIIVIILVLLGTVIADVGARMAISKDETHQSGVIFSADFGGKIWVITDTLANNGSWIDIYYNICDLVGNCIVHSKKIYF